MAKDLDLRGLSQGRLDEDILVTQYNGVFSSDSQRDAKERLSAVIDVAVGKIDNSYPDGTPMPSKLLVENSIKNAIMDIAKLANESAPTFRGVSQGEKQTDKDAAGVLGAILETYQHFGKLDRQRKRLYMDFIMAGFGAVAVHKRKSSKYPVFKRLDPKYTYPHVRGGELLDVFYTESVRVLTLKQSDPDLYKQLDLEDGDTVQFVDYYTDFCVAQAVLQMKEGRAYAGGVHLLNYWEHDLECVPVAFHQLESVDDSYRGLMDQADGPLATRNLIVQFMTDYIESMVHTPFEEKGIINFDDEPGPLTVFHHDPTAQESFMRRVAPAAPASQVFNLLTYLEAAEETELAQPATRTGDVRQSQASGSFVNSTQGQLTTIVRDLQDGMSFLLQDANYIGMKIDERHLNEKKPMCRAVGKKNTYTPDKDIDGWHYHRISFGAAAGIGALQGQARVLQDLGARLIDRDGAREQIDYIDDITDLEDRVQREAINDAVLQRFATDPNTPFDALIEVADIMAQGKGIVAAVTAIKQRAKEAADAQSGAGGAVPPGAEGAAPAGLQPGAEGVTPEATGGQPSEAEINLPAPSISQIITRGGGF